MARRTRNEIIEDILAETIRGKGITGIMYSCNLSFYLTKSYIGTLVKAGYLDEEKNPNYGKKGKGKSIKTIYTTTRDGWDLLNALEKREGTEKVEKFL